MARADLINRLYSRNKTPLEFQFQSLMAPPLLSLLSPYDIAQLFNIARDPKLSAKLNKKLEMIKAILEPRGFIKFHSGTNRVVYRYLEDQSFLIKIALDKVGLGDNPMEYQNQFVLAPFVTKVFEVSPCGTVGLFERVEPITSRQEFISIGEDVFDLINDKFVGEYVLEDIGTQYFMNWGIRRGFGPVLLDFPYCYKLDGNKLYCNKIDIATGITCGGAIDYDNGFNNLVCTKCGAKIFAKDLQMGIDKQNIILKGRKEHSTMKVEIIIPGQKTQVKDTTMSAKTYAQQVVKKKKTMEISILNNKPLLSPAEEAKQLFAQSQAAKAKKDEEIRQAALETEYETERRREAFYDYLDSDEEEDVTTEEDTQEETIPEDKPEERNTSSRHEYVPKQSAPYAKPQEEDLSDSYLEMNASDDEDESVEEEAEDNTSEETEAEVITSPTVEETVKPKESLRPTATVRDTKPVVRSYDKEAEAMIPDYDSDTGRPAKKKNNRDSQGKFIKQK